MTLQDKIKLALEKGRIGGAKKLASQLLKDEHRAEWDKGNREVYDVLFPVFRDMTEEEYLLSVRDEDGSLYDEYVGYIDLKIIPQIAIDYSKDKDYLSYKEWLNETKVVTEAVEEVSHIETVDGIETKVVDIEAVTEVTEKLRPYVPLEVTKNDVLSKLETFEEYKEHTKKAKEDAKRKVLVDNNNISYNGDPDSINFMSAVGAIGAMRMFQIMVRDGVITPEQYAEVYKTNTGWKGADNAVHVVQIESIVEACELSMLEQAKVVGAK